MSRSQQAAVVPQRWFPFTAAGLAPPMLISVAYLVVRPAAVDFASGDFRAHLFRRHVVLWNNLWFGGHSLPGYGVVSPMLNGLFGVVPVAIGSAFLASWCFMLIARRCYELRPTLADPRLAIVLFSMSTCVSLWGGRLTFGPAVAFGTACIAAQQRNRPWIAALCAALCGLSSPVGVVSLGIVLGACFVANSLPRRQLMVSALACVVPAAVVMVVFPEGGWYPFTLGSLVLLSVALGILGWFGRQFAIVRAGVIAYALVAVAAFVWRSPLGGNVVRLGWLAAGPVGALTITRFRRTLVPAFAAFTLIWSWSYVKMGFVPTDVAAAPGYYTPLTNYVLSLPGGPQRVEVLPTVSFSQADGVALKIGIARGWETQLDRDLNPEFYGEQLTADNFHAWLLNHSVALVAVPDAPLQASAKEEAALIGSNLGYLDLAWSDAHWHVYRVTDAQPLADNGASVASVEPESLTLLAPNIGLTTVRFRYAKWYDLESGDGCVFEGPDGWIDVLVRTPGTIVLKVALTPGEIVGDAESCSKT
jgi:hypothetical protein